MNKNPFIPQSTYTPPQPPLPPGPAPPPPTQTDYSAYWAAASAQQAGANAYNAHNAQWTGPSPARPSAEQSALYANYGYGPQSQWQRQQQQQQQQHQQQQFHPPLPAQAPPSYNPYQPAVGYSPYVPQVQPMAQPGYPMQQAQSVPMQPMFSAPMQQQPQQQQMRQQQHNPSPQHLPPAKRQRFDGPQHRTNQLPTQPHFQLPMAPMAPTQPSGAYPIPGQANRGGNSLINAGRGGSMRGGPVGGRGGGRGIPMNPARGGMANRGARPSGGFIAGANRGGAALRGHNSRGNFGGLPNNRRGGGGGGSFNMGTGVYPAGPFRGGRGAQNHTNRGGRHDGFGAREGSMSSSFGSVSKKDENKRTLTDFKIVGLEILELSWSWGVLPTTTQNARTPDDMPEPEILLEPSETLTGVGPTPAEEGAAVKKEGDPSGGDDVDKHKDGEDADSVSTELNQTASSVKPTSSSGSLFPEPSELPSRIRIYFHTPVTADDARLNPQTHPPVAPSFANSRKGKRKKLEDDDPLEGDEGRAHRPPPHLADDRDSVAGSVAPSAADTAASEHDWLMAAIVDGEDYQEQDSEANTDTQPAVNVETRDDATDVDPTEDLQGNATDVEMHDDEETAQSNAVVDLLTVEDEVEAQIESGSEKPTDEPVQAPDVVMPESSADTEHVEAAPSPSPAVSLPETASENHVETQTADKLSFIETQVSEPPETQEDLEVDPPGLSASSPPVTNGLVENSPPIATAVPEHLPEPPASPVMQSATTSVASPHPEPTLPVIASLPSRPAKTSSPNRLSISYANGNRRLIIDSESVTSVKVFRAEGRIEVNISASMGDKDLRGIVLEGLAEASHSYAPLPPFDEAVDFDSTLPPFAKVVFPTTLTLVAYLDTSKPLSEPKWVKTGDIHDWLKSMLGRMFWVAGDAAEGWEKKITVVDPDPPPTIHNVLDSWAGNSLVGAQNERERFVKTHMSEMDNLLEILLRLVRGERATSSFNSNNSSSMSGSLASMPSSISGPLLSAMSTDSAHGAQQTHVSLAVLAIFRLATDYAEKLEGEKGKAAVNESVGEIIRCIPSHLIYKSLDGIFKEWRTDKKGH